jgi:hypothetical protein
MVDNRTSGRDLIHRLSPISRKSGASAVTYALKGYGA